MENTHIFSRVLKSQQAAAKVAAALVERSAWFSIEPLPNDQWEVQAKANEGLEIIVDEAGRVPTLWTVAHTHEYGATVVLARCSRDLYQIEPEALADYLEFDFEPDKGEEIEVHEQHGHTVEISDADYRKLVDWAVED
jgi:hypothetical protein